MTARIGYLEACHLLTQITGTGELNKDFHALDSNAVNRIIMEADERRYRKPKNANGSRARYFYAYLQRCAHKDL